MHQYYYHMAWFLTGLTGRTEDQPRKDSEASLELLVSQSIAGRKQRAEETFVPIPWLALRSRTFG